ncbi:MAG: sensor histidine kinase [Acidimicrobiia bacterium]|nr:sensor histidine kinase [Acidimicrobiia bacterium]
MPTGTSSAAAVPYEESTPRHLGPFIRWPRSSDAVLATVVFVLEVIGILVRTANESGEFTLSMLGDVPAATYLLLAASSVALLWRRRRPLIVLLATLTAGLVWDVIGLAYGPSLAIFVSLYGVGRYIADTRTSLLAVAAALILVVADDVIEGESVSVFGFSLAVVLVGWYLGTLIKGRREYLALVEERAEYLERAQAAEAQRAVDEERTRIARELHDLVAHRVSMMTVQAGAAQTVAASDPARAVRAMEAIEQAGREALDELRQVLGVLRPDGHREALGPMHGLADIPGLVREMNDAGLKVSLSNNVVHDVVPAKVDLATYRIVQEALTNVLKHAGPDPTAEVRLSANDQMLTIEVTDRGSGVSTLPGSGHGLLGMRERAGLLGGTFEAGPRPEGGFRIMARLPLERNPS